MNLEKEIKGLKKPEPSVKFCSDAKERLMHKISIYENESWLARLLKKLSPILPSENFVQAARIRLMERIEAAKRPVIWWLKLTKQVVASTLVMTIAVTSVLFFAGGKQPVSASENSYLEVASGKVAIKHADKLIWDEITTQIELAEGDLIQLEAPDSAVIHFFDDSQLRLKGEGLLLISRMNVSPGYAKQGIIDVTLHNGNAWVQTLNVDDGSASFTMVTPNAIISTINASFNVQTNLPSPTVIKVFRNSVGVQALDVESRKVFSTGKLNYFQKISLDSEKSYYNQTVDLAVVAPIIDLTSEDRDDGWVMDNLKADTNHLAQLRDREITNLKASAGVLPGQMLYPLKRAKEQLTLALSFNEESQTKAQIDIANQRLNESIVLIEQGKTDKAKEVLAEYQNLIHKITESKKPEIANLDRLSNNVVVAHQKTLIAALPSDSQVGIVKEVLDQTEELLTEDPIKKAEIRMQNSLEELTHIQDFIASGDLAAAKETLINHQSLAPTLLNEVSTFSNDDQKKEFYNNILNNQYEERRILNEIAKVLANRENAKDLVALAESTGQNLDDGIKVVAETIKPLEPDIVLAQAVISPTEKRLQEFVDKINIYNTWTGQKNQIDRLLTKYPQYARDMDFLTKLRDKTDTRTKDLINAKIIKLKGDLVVAKSKRVKLKIGRSIQLREMSK